MTVHRFPPVAAQPPRITLVSMPWPWLNMPSIQLGTLTSVLHRAGAEVRTCYYYLDFMDFIAKATEGDGEGAAFTIEDYETLSDSSWQNGLGDWIFARGFASESPENEARYAAYIANRADPALVVKSQRARDLAPEFLDWCVQDLLSRETDAIGFTTTFNQNVASLNLAQRIKRASPSTTIVFGGANCDGPMGAGLHRSFSFVDYVVRGEAEYTFPALLEVLAGRREPSSVSGLCFRENGETVVIEPDRDPVKMADVPTPDFDEYFRRLRTSSFRGAIDHGVSLPVESSRGCWWGEKHHCTFCGLNGTTMAFRSKNGNVFGAELAELSRKYKSTKFQVVDNILDMRYFNSLLPRLAAAREAGDDYSLFYETKANLRKEHLKALRDAGVYRIQPGIESLSSHVLRLIDKGVTALQNVRLLKWAREYGIAISWNMLVGFPGETAEDYDEVYELMPSLTHLEPPSVAKLLLERFSPYFEAPERYGITITGPVEFYEMIYPLAGAELHEIAYDFAYAVAEYDTGKSVRRVMERLRDQWPRHPERGTAVSSLRYSRGAGFLTIRDRRRDLTSRDLTLSGTSAAIYLACDAGATIPQLVEHFPAATYDEIEELLESLLASRLMYRENGVYLALAVADRPVIGYAGIGSAIMRGEHDQPPAVQRDVSPLRAVVTV